MFENKNSKFSLLIIHRYLCSNNPDWISRGITIEEANLQNLPLSGIPLDLNVCIDDSVQTLDKVIIETGPEILQENTETTDPIETYIESNNEEPLQIDRIGMFVDCEWPKVNPKPINEYEYDGLASMLFPKLFPLGKGDPTKKARLLAVTETDGFKHLLKYAVLDHKDEHYYPFAQHPRFKFWAYDRLRRHRTLDQSKIYLKQNLGKIKLI
jgi:hypothetical protein